MPDRFTPYSAEAIQSAMAEPSRAALRHLTILEQVDSTNLALQRLPVDQQHGHAMVADRQISGRGRHGRHWHSPPGRNIYLSLGWSFRRAAGSLTRLPLGVAVMAVRSLQRAGLGRAGIKWPNDIQVSDRKLAGILVELSNTVDREANAVIGVGMNVWMPAEEAGRSAIDQPWTDVCTHLAGAADAGLRNRLCSMLLDELLRGVELFDEQDFEPFAEDWKRWDVLRGREITVHGAEHAVRGKAWGISDRGGLLVACPAESGVELREFFAGDVRVRAC